MIGDICVVDLQYIYGFCVIDEGEKISVVQKWCVDFVIVGLSFVLGDLFIYMYYMLQFIMLKMKIKELLCD